MGQILIPKHLAENINSHGTEIYPHECCGVLLGSVEKETHIVKQLLPVENEFDGAKNNRFLITPEIYRKSDEYARKHGLDIIGFYHSHPDSPAQPSEYDRDHAWPWYSYIIVSIKNKKAGELLCWRLEDDRSKFRPTDINIIDKNEGV